MSHFRNNVSVQMQERNVRLLFDAELTSGALDAKTLEGPRVSRAVRARGVPPRPWRVVQQLRYKRGELDFERAVIDPYMAARREFVGEDIGGRPRFLVRVDEFPHYLALDDPQRFGASSYEHFHEIMLTAGIPYLVAVLARVSREPLSPAGTESRPLDDGEIGTLRRLGDERVSFALHGRDHRTRFISPRRHSELCGLSPSQTEELLDLALQELSVNGIHPHVFVPPFNRFDANQFAPLARRFDVICGGPESIGLLGFHRSPQWRSEAVYLPSYLPFYGRARDILPAVKRAIERQTGLWIPIVLHWGWEAEADWTDLQRLVSVIGPYATPWAQFLEAVRRSR